MTLFKVSCLEWVCKILVSGIHTIIRQEQRQPHVMHPTPFEELSDISKPKLLDQVRHHIRVLHYSIRTKAAYL